MNTNPPPLRIPKLKVRNQIDRITPVSVDQHGRSEPQDEVLATSVPFFPTPALSHSPSPQPAASTTGEISTISDEPTKKKGSLMNFLSIKEPSTAAFTQYADEQTREAGLKSSRTVALQGASHQKLPDYVPKVNSKWDGMPKIAHEPGHDGWKRSMEQPSLLDRISKKSSTFDTSKTSRKNSTQRGSNGSSSTTSRNGSHRKRRDSGRRDGHGMSSNGSTTNQHHKANLEPLSLSRSPSVVNIEPAQQFHGDQLPYLSTHSLTLDGQKASTPQHTEEIINLSTPTLQPHSRTESIHQIISSNTITTPKEARDQISTDLTISCGSDQAGTATLKHMEDCKFCRSNKVDLEGQRLISLNPNASLSEESNAPDSDDAQWPLPSTPTNTALTEVKIASPPPPIPLRSPARQQQSSSQHSTNSSPLPQSSASPPPSPRNFARPFNTGPLTPPSSQSPTFSATVSPTAYMPNSLPEQDYATASDSVAGLLLRSSGNAFAPRVLRPPMAFIGRPVTKDSALTPIPESDASSLLSVPVRESHVLGDSEQVVAGSQELSISRPTTADSHPAGSPSMIDDDGEQDLDSTSVHSELTTSLQRSPKERLMRHDHADVPWPLEHDEDLDYVAGTGARSGELEKEMNEDSSKRRSKLGSLIKW